MYKHRRKIWICIAIILLSCLGCDSCKEYLASIVPKDIYYYVDNSLEESFANIIDNESIILNYNLLKSEDSSKANIVLTSDFNIINAQSE